VPTYRKDLGRAVIRPAERVEAGSCGSWDIVYTVGEAGIERGGKVSFGIPHGFSIPQVDNPLMPGYCTAECSSAVVSLVLRCTRSTSNALDYKSGEYGSINTGVKVHVCEAGLVAGETIIFHYGDTTQGAPGGFARTIEGPAVFDILVCPMDAWSDAVHYYYLETAPTLQVVARRPKKIYIVLPSVVRAGEKASVHVTAKDEFENTAARNDITFGLCGEGALGGEEQEIGLQGPVARAEIALVEKAGVGRVRITSAPPRGLTLETHPVLVAEGDGLDLYWGDLHCHSFASDGLNEPDHLYEYARDIDRADFAAIADHAYMSDEGWRQCTEAAAKYNRDHEFVTFLGYEHSAAGSHRNVYFKADRGKLIRHCREAEMMQGHMMGFADGADYRTRHPSAGSTPELFESLCDEECMVIPHLHRMDWENHDPAFESLVEMYSNWGNREYPGCKYASVAGTRDIDTVQHALSLGYRLGFVGGGDGHAGRPGKDYWLRVRGARPCGISGIYAKELTRDALWEALKARHCYATTGKRIIVKFELNGSMMGDTVRLSRADTAREIRVRVYGTARLRRLTLVKNNIDIHVVEPEKDEADFRWAEGQAAESGDYYYLRVEQADGAMAWSSPVWVEV